MPHSLFPASCHTACCCSTWLQCPHPTPPHAAPCSQLSLHALSCHTSWLALRTFPASICNFVLHTASYYIIQHCPVALHALCNVSPAHAHMLRSPWSCSSHLIPQPPHGLKLCAHIYDACRTKSHRLPQAPCWLPTIKCRCEVMDAAAPPLSGIASASSQASTTLLCRCRSLKARLEPLCKAGESMQAQIHAHTEHLTPLQPE